MPWSPALRFATSATDQPKLATGATALLAAQSGEVGAASEILVAKAEQVFPGQSSAWLLPLHASSSRAEGVAPLDVQQ